MIKDRIITLSATILLMCIVMSFLYPSQFPTVENFSQIMLNLSIDTIVAVGMMLLMISGVFDLSVGSIVAFSGGLAGYLMYYHDVNFLLAIAAALSGSLLIGFINGFLITKIGINPMIQTLAKKLGISLPMQAGKGYSFTVPEVKNNTRIPSIFLEARVAVTQQLLRRDAVVECVLEFLINDAFVSRMHVDHHEPVPVLRQHVYAG